MADQFMDLKTKMSENPDFTEKINRLQDVTIEISYVNMCGALCGGTPHFCHIFGGFCLNY